MKIKAKEVKTVDPKMGIELECYVSDRLRGVLQNRNSDIVNSCCLKAASAAKEEYEKSAIGFPKGLKWGTDGGSESLGNGMPELRFPPEVYTNIMKGRSEIERLLAALSSRYLTSDNEISGMHVHVQRDYLTLEDYKKIIKFFRENKNFVRTFSKRGLRASTYIDNALSGNDLSNESTFAQGATNSNQCIRLNCPWGHPTVEFRLFNGTLDPIKFIANVQFIERLINFVKNYETEEVNRANFIDFIIESGSEYNPLLEDLKRLDILDSTASEKEQKFEKEEAKYFGIVI